MAMICNAYGAWTWETLRRVPDYIKLYNFLVKLGIVEELLGQKTRKLIASRTYPELEKWGLLLPANPAHNVDKANVFWHPNVFKSVVRFHLVDAKNVGDKSQYIKLSDYPATRTHFRGVDGSYHIRLMGENFWFQMQCDDIDLTDEDVLIGVEFNRISDMERRAKTASELFGIYDNSISLSAPLHVPNKVYLHKKSVIAYDVRASGGTWKDVIIALNHPKIFEESVEIIKAKKEDARNSYNRGKAFIEGDFLAILDKN